MKLAIIGSRSLTTIEIGGYIPEGVDEIVSGGAKGVDALAKEYADRHGISLREFLPQYDRYGKAAPIKRNERIAVYADEVLAFWDGRSQGTARTVALFRRLGKRATVVLLETNQPPGMGG